MLEHIWLVKHEYDLYPISCREEVRIIGVYTTEKNAKEALQRALKKPGFSDSIDGFSISRYKVNQYSWQDGFVSDVEAFET